MEDQIQAEVDTQRQFENLWRQYELQVGLFKFYWELVVKVSAFHYAITGAVTSYALSHKGEGLVRWALVIPFVLSVGFALVGFSGARAMRVLHEEFHRLARALELLVFPSTEQLRLLIRTTSWSFVFIALGLLVAFFSI